MPNDVRSGEAAQVAERVDHGYAAGRGPPVEERARQGPEDGHGGRHPNVGERESQQTQQRRLDGGIHTPTQGCQEGGGGDVPAPFARPVGVNADDHHADDRAKAGDRHQPADVEFPQVSQCDSSHGAIPNTPFL